MDDWNTDTWDVGFFVPNHVNSNQGATITPVTYGGRLPKSKLEQMFGRYAAAGMMQMASNLDNRMNLLRFVFNINEKKAEGVVMRATTKMAMGMLKTEEGKQQMQEMAQNMMGGEGMEGMAEMMQMMGGEGMGDLAGLMGGADGGAVPDVAQLTEMLSSFKAMKDSGAIPPEELETLRKEFKNQLGTSVDELMEQAKAGGEALSPEEEKLLNLMNDILG